MEALIKSGWYGEQAMIGLAVTPNTGQYRLVRVQRFRSEVRLLQAEVLSGREQLLQKVRQWPTLPLAIYVDSPSVVEKVIDRDVPDEVAAVLGVQVENRREFFTQQVSLSAEKQRVSLIRRTEVEAVLSDLSALSDRILSVAISPGLQVFLIPAFGNYVSGCAYALQVAEEQYGWQDQPLAVVPVAAETLTPALLAEALEMPEACLPAYAMLYDQYLSGYPDGGAAFPELARNRRRIRQLTTWTRMLGIGAGILLLGSLIGAGWQLSQSYQTDRAMQQIGQNRELLREIRENDQRIRQARSFLSQAEAGVLAPSRISYYTDQLAYLAPPDLEFDRLLAWPTEGEFRKLTGQKAVRLPDMLLAGKAASAAAISAFSSQLQQLAFVGEAEILHTDFDFREEEHSFLIRINIETTSTAGWKP